MQTGVEKQKTNSIIVVLAMGAADVFRFGAFELDIARSRLYQRDQRLSVPNSQLEILIRLVSNAPGVVSKKSLVDAGWPGVDVSLNSVDQAISRLRKLLGRREDGAAFIETVAGEGYRFAAPTERAERLDRDAPLDAQLAPYRAFVQGLPASTRSIAKRF